MKYDSNSPICHALLCDLLNSRLVTKYQFMVFKKVMGCHRLPYSPCCRQCSPLPPPTSASAPTRSLLRLPIFILPPHQSFPIPQPSLPRCPWNPTFLLPTLILPVPHIIILTTSDDDNDDNNQAVAAFAVAPIGMVPRHCSCV